MPSIRGIKIGDRLMSVLSRFMLEPEGLMLLEDYSGEFSVLYGDRERPFNAYAVLRYEEGKPSYLTYYTGAWIVLYFDESPCVREVRYSIDW
ncbi:MAG TPA: hypothetical protein DD735_10130 [Clostridiales bacterium]|nr:hypothetical protein [Clostridiales bacterium]